MRRATFALVPALLFLPARPASAQAYTPPAGVGAVTLGWQYVDNTGHRMTDGYLLKAGTSVDMTLFVETEYGFTDRLAASIALAYVSAKYTDPNPGPFGWQDVDACHCWNSSLQDFTFSARYRLGNDPWAVTPLLRAVVPSHDYPTKGEAVVGRHLREVQVGAAVGWRFPGLRPAAVQAGYTYAFVERVEGISTDRSNGWIEVGASVTRRLYLRADARWQVTHGGLRFGSVTGNPFFPPGEVDTPELQAEHDRLLRDDNWRVGAGLSYSWGDVDLFAGFTKYVWGTDTHDGQAYTAGLTYYFGGPFRP